MSGTEYQKISSLYRFDQETRAYTEQYSTPEIEALKDVEWVFTEKVDGTNIRVIWDGYRVTLAGRTDNAQLPPKLLRHLEGKFSGPENEVLFEQNFGSTPVVLYGEGYGGKIQKGGKYRPDESFVLFDAQIDGIWLKRDSVWEIAFNFDVEIVPLVMRGTLAQAIGFVRRGMMSAWSEFEAEGLVGVTAAGVLDRRGNRIAVKIKGRDLK